MVQNALAILQMQKSAYHAHQIKFKGICEYGLRYLYRVFQEIEVPQQEKIMNVLALLDFSNLKSESNKFKHMEWKPYILL